MIYGYGCVTSTKILRTDAEALKKTKAYISLRDLFIQRKLPVENIRMDLITGTYRKRKELQWLLDNASYGDCVIITSLHSLGNPEEARNNYMQLYKKNIAIELVVVEKCSEEQLNRLRSYTTAINYKLAEGMFYRGGGVPTVIVENIENMESAQELTSDNRGRAFSERPEYFKEVYWLYENYFLAESETYNNPLIHIGKKQFHRLASEYETLDPDFAKDLREQERLYHISTKPKRHGAVPELFETFLEKEKTVGLKQAAQETNMPFKTKLEAERYVLKYEGGRKAMAEANKQKDTSYAKEIVTKTFALREN